MSEPRPPAAPPPAPSETVTVEQPLAAPADIPTVTASGTSTAATEFGVPNPLGRYTITRLLGRGGMGAVFLAHDTQLHRPVALKVPTFHGALTAGQKRRFFREARSIAALRHPNVCPVFDADEERGVLYLTMAYIEGQTLASVLGGRPLEPTGAARLVRTVALAMQAAHEHGTIHRDLKPANILIDRAGEPVVMDFGLARKTEEDEAPLTESRATAGDIGATQVGSVLGTPAYMPPEQATGDLPRIGPRSDVYALGVVLYECLTGRRPFDGPDPGSVIDQILHATPVRPREIQPDIDAALERACLKAMARDPADRYASMTEFAAALKEAVEPELQVLPPPLPRTPADRPTRKRRRWLTPAGCVGVVLAVLVVCVGGPTAAVWWLIDKTSEKVKEIQEGQQRSSAEWEAILRIWQAPPEGAGPDVLLPPAFGDGHYRRVRHDRNVADAEFGITAGGVRGIYTGPEQHEYVIRVYRCPESEAKAIQERVYALAKARQHGDGKSAPGSNGNKAIYAARDTGRRTVTYGFADASFQDQRYGQLWYSQGWLFWFETAVPLEIEVFPTKYLLEVGKHAAADGKK